MSVLPSIPDNAPFSAEQRAWLNGFLAAMFPAGTGDASNVQEIKPVTIVFASQTGNSEALAKQLGKIAKSSSFTPTIKDISDIDIGSLSNDPTLFIASTYGEGDPPDTAIPFWEKLSSADAPKLESLSYSVLALGDSSYPDFCEFGKRLDNRLKELGATCIADRIDCDVDFDEDFDSWSKTVFEKLGSVSAPQAELPQVDSTIEYSKKNPFPAKLSDNHDLNKKGSQKETRHIEIDISGSGLSYEAGDAIGIIPKNNQSAALALIEACDLDATTEVDSVSGSKKTLLDALVSDYDIKSLNKKFIENYNLIANSSELSEIVSDKEKMKAYLWGREPIDVLLEYPTKFETAEVLLGLLKKLNPRLYSIASSSKIHPEKVQLTIGIVRYESNGREREGVCSTYLADRASEDTFGVFMHPNKAFKVPADKTKPMIMVGPGTGIAPFRAFLQEREATQATGKNWLFFGDQHAATDFIYQEEIEGFQKSGYLHQLDLAFSRDQAEKVYVQDRMREKGKHLFEWLEEGGYFFVCGDASRMAKDVDTALHQVIADHGSMSAEEAQEYVKKLKAEKRYVRDVY